VARRDENAVRLSALGLSELKGEAPVALGRSFGPMAGAGVIPGPVTNANTPAPVASPFVYVYDCAGRYITLIVTDGAGVYSTSATLDTGTYYSSVLKAGFIQGIYNGVLYPPDGDVTNGTPISVSSGVTTGSINFSLKP